MKIKRIVLLIACLLMISACVYAADEVSFIISYDGIVVENEAKAVNIVLEGKSAPTYTQVRVKVDVSGPATPTLIAKDSLGADIDIAQTGYWGPAQGFPIQGDFKNETPVTATFPKAGEYTITVSLLDLANSNTVITTKTITVDVQEQAVMTNTIENTITNTVENTVENTVNNEEVTELPKTGTSLVEYVIYALVILAFVYMIYSIKKKNIS